jgi:peptidyl-prolyl cis-trans isomerase SurA
MKIRSSFLLILLSALTALCQAQDLNNRILVTVDGKGVQAGEFMRMYRKSLEPGKQLNIDEYLDQFIVFKLKVADAVRSGIDTTRAFKKELAGYRDQLAQSYLTDTKAKEKLIQKAYQRSLTEINCWHILISLSPEASPADTLKAWTKATDIRERIVSGEPFEQVARGTSDDQSVKLNGGNLGYFTVFQMIMPFEDAAYSLKKGSVSMPVRTPYGYHIIKVADKRPSKGKILIAHIMKSAPPGTGDKEAKLAAEQINEIYNKLVAGASFKDLAREYSDHKESAAKGGELNWFGAGEIISDFAEAAFAIKDTGKYTKPVRTIYGWHIIKLLNRKAPGTLEESRSYLESKINQSYLNSISKKSFVDNLRKKYNFRVNQVAHDWFVNNTDTLIIQGLRKYDRSEMPEGNIYTFANQRFTTKEFANYIEKRGSMVVTSDSLVFIDSSIELRSSDHITSYENSVLEEKYPEFRYLMNEFHDGILLFEISGKKVWNKVSEDSAGLRSYYDKNKGKYLSRPALDGSLYILRKAGADKELQAAWKKYSKKADSDRRMTEKFIVKKDTLLSIEKKIWYKGDNPDIDKADWKEGYTPVSTGKYPSILSVRRILEPAPLSLDEVRGEMMKGYQEYLESEWIRQLKVKYSVKTDGPIFDEVKRKLKNE